MLRLLNYIYLAFQFLTMNIPDESDLETCQNVPDESHSRNVSEHT